MLQNAGRSSGLRLDTSVLGPREHTTTSSSTQLAPALSRSVRRLGHDVIIRPRTTSASIIVHGAWQMAATGRPESKKLLVNCTAEAFAQKVGFATPPGSTRPSYSDAVTPSAALSASNVSAGVRWLNA